MDPLTLSILLILVGIVVLVAELMIPSHGILGVLSAVAFLGAVIALFAVGPWFGVTALAVLTVASPFVIMGMLHTWPNTPLGKRMVLNTVTPAPPRDARLAVGQLGKATTELRPMGECEFDGTRLESVSQLGIIAVGSPVRIVSLEADGRPIVQVA